jgi:hypothetical protein
MYKCVYARVRVYVNVHVHVCVCVLCNHERMRVLCVNAYRCVCVGMSYGGMPGGEKERRWHNRAVYTQQREDRVCKPPHDSTHIHTTHTHHSTHLGKLVEAYTRKVACHRQKTPFGGVQWYSTQTGDCEIQSHIFTNAQLEHSLNVVHCLIRGHKTVYLAVLTADQREHLIPIREVSTEHTKQHLIHTHLCGLRGREQWSKRNHEIRPA